MRKRKWIFFRITVYMGLAAAIVFLSLLFYFGFVKYRNFTQQPETYLMIGCLLLQIIFQVLNARLISQYLNTSKLPEKSFSIIHTTVLSLNICIALALIWLFLYGFSETFFTKTHRVNGEDVLALIVIAIYTFITVYTLSASVVLRRYLKLKAQSEEASWLNQLGSLSLNE